MARRQEDGLPSGQGSQAAGGGPQRSATRSLPAAPSFRLLYTDYRPDADLAEPSRQQLPQPVLALTFGIEGESAFDGRCGTHIHFKPGHATLTAFHASDGQRHYQGGRSVRQLRLIAGLDVLSQYLDEAQCRQLLAPDSGIRLLSSRALTVDAQMAVQALLCLSDAARPDRMQMHMLMLGLLSGQLRHLLGSDVGPTAAMSSAEGERIEQARRLLDEHLDRPVCLADVAQAVGLSETRLRQGFVRRFQANPQQYLLAQRMRRAHCLLQSGCQVAQAAYAVGYGHPGNFSAAFSRFFGYAPKAVFRGGVG